MPEAVAARFARGRAVIRALPVWCAVLFTIMVAGAVTRASAQAAPPPATQVNALASVRLRVEYWNWFDAANTDGEYAYLGGFVRFGARQDRGSVLWHVEAAAPFMFGLPDDAVAAAPQGAAGLGANYRVASGTENLSVFLKQGFLSFRLQKTPELRLRAGRFEFSDGAEGPPAEGVLASLRRDRIAERLIGPFGFSHIGRSFDGVELRSATASTGVTLLAARATQGVFNLHGMPELPVDIGYVSLTRLVSLASGKADARLFALGYRDTRELPKADNRPAAARLADSSTVQLLTLGGHLLAVTKPGNAQADVLLWGAAQLGDWGALDHSAYAFAIEAGVQWKVRHLDPWLRAGYARGSGDDDAQDNQHGTFFQVLPTPRVYARFPFYNLMNSDDLFFEMVLRPTADWTVRSDVHVLQLARMTDSWYAGGGAFEDATFGYTARPGRARALARLLDLSIDYRVSPQLSFGAYIAHADPQREIEEIYPGTSAGLLGLLEARWRR